jgi:hypothetical protein
MVEAAGLVKGNNVHVIDHGSTTLIDNNGLYRFTADDPPTAAVLDGRALVTFGDRKVNLKKGRETVLAENLKQEKFDTKKDDELYAWSNVRSAYEAAASYRVSQTAYNSGLGVGLNGFYNPGWYWDNGFSSWAWLPGMGAFYSPFGYGFYSPGLIPYAPVITVPVYRGGVYASGNGHPIPGNGWRGHPGQPVTVAGNNGIVTKVPISPRNPPAVGASAFARSPSANQAARIETARSLAASGGFRTASGAPAPTFAGRGAATSVSGGNAHAMGGASANGGGSHGGGASAGGGFHAASASSGGGHAASGGGAHR